MRKTITITDVKKRDEQLWLLSEAPSFSLEGAIPKRYMLVDSVERSFVYIVEQADEFVYVSIPQPCWREIKEVLTQPLTVFLQAGTVELELAGFQEELAYLIGNIEGNANYGEEMEKAVKDTFLT
ncbi:hypothetical protein [Anoxybacillus sp. J5B_2022]|uniref:UPF0738 family protein n=1 Tax=Anoxybacillus sp. J5B_2022 TaxID=3003246 RepID=UPI00228566E7|nr:hypothetical protein [Anoxybacillus sp. J5B_2022]MCZ0756149.1 hypothetical protein [Anoxybacillus sp. J5B_2022]